MSHDTMPTFMSGTDLGTLKAEGAEANHFVSLIVNNAGTYTAAITRKVTEVSKGVSVVEYNTFNNKNVKEEEAPFELEDSYIEYYPLDITVEVVPVLPKSELELRLEEVQNNSKSIVNRKNNLWPVKPFEQPKKEYVQTMLFSEEDMGNSKSKDPKEIYELDNDVAYGDIHVKDNILKDTITQIITGDIFSIYKQGIDLNKWAVNMEKLYDKRFNIEVNKNTEDEEDPLEGFLYWADTFTEFLEDQLPDDALGIKKEREYIDAIWAYDVMEALEKDYPSNKYIQGFIKSLERWLL